MDIAIASGKGGTGKTTFAVALALCAAAKGEPVRLLDCDVEAPNCALFLDAGALRSETVCRPVPVVDAAKCTACGKCAQVCRYNAVAVVKKGALIFRELCHGCGGCALVCPERAITEEDHPIGVVETGAAGPVAFVQGRLRVGEAVSPPLIRAVKRFATPERLNILDCPPGTSCPVIAAVKGCDAAVLVTEPTPFGLNDLVLAVGTVRALGVPFGVIVNRSDIGDDRVGAYCRSEGIPVLLQVSEERRIAEAYSRGRTLLDAAPEHAGRLWGVLEAARNLAATPAGREVRR